MPSLHAPGRGTRRPIGRRRDLQSVPYLGERRGVLLGCRRTSPAAREAVAKDTLRVLRLKIELYKFDHKGIRPGYDGASKKDAGYTQDQFIFCTNIEGKRSTFTAPSGEYICGPYFLELPENAVNGLSTIKIVNEADTFAAKADDSTGWLYKRETGDIRCNSNAADSTGINHYDY